VTRENVPITNTESLDTRDRLKALRNFSIIESNARKERQQKFRALFSKPALRRRETSRDAAGVIDQSLFEYSEMWKVDESSAIESRGRSPRLAVSAMAVGRDDWVTLKIVGGKDAGAIIKPRSMPGRS